MKKVFLLVIVVIFIVSLGSCSKEQYNENVYSINSKALVNKLLATCNEIII